MIKESNNLGETSIFGLDKDSYLEYDDLDVRKQWILSLSFSDIKDKGISERGMRNFKQKIRQGKGLKNVSKIARILIKAFKSKGFKST